ncbi:MAG: hypothetical protein GF364_16725 [Candidatus Lokiarchaeota archaeon]|nr:hypothetical protein [Candidatus Lokiarchaeota archaeon]
MTCHKLKRKARRKRWINPLKSAELYYEAAQCFEREGKEELTAKMIYQSLKMYSKWLSKNTISANIIMDDVLRITKKGIKTFKTHNPGINTKTLNSIIGNLLLLKDVQGYFDWKNKSEAAFLTIELAEFGSRNGLFSEQQIQKITTTVEEIANSLMKAGNELLTGAKFIEASKRFLNASLIFSKINQPKMNLAMQKYAKAKKLIGKMALGEDKYDKAAFALKDAFKAYLDLEDIPEALDCKALLEKSLSRGKEIYNEQDKTSYKKILLLEEEFQQLSKSLADLQKARKPSIIKESPKPIEETTPEPLKSNTQQIISAKGVTGKLQDASIVDLRKEKFAIEQTIASIEQMYRDGLLSSEDFARLLLGNNRKLYQISHIIEERKKTNTS